jgi:hypothetical protein
MEKRLLTIKKIKLEKSSDRCKSRYLILQDGAFTWLC